MMYYEKGYVFFYNKTAVYTVSKKWKTKHQNEPFRKGKTLLLCKEGILTRTVETRETLNETRFTKRRTEGQ